MSDPTQQLVVSSLVVLLILLAVALGLCGLVGAWRRWLTPSDPMHVPRGGWKRYHAILPEQALVDIEGSDSECNSYDT
jgi:hypothetical protein